MPFDAEEYLRFFGVKGIKPGRNGNILAHCPNFFGLHPRGDKRRSFGILAEPKYDPIKREWVPAGTANCFVCGGMSLETLTAHFLSRILGKQVNEMEAYLWLESKGWLPEDISDTPVENVLSFLKNLGNEETIPTYDPAVLDEYLEALHPSALQRGEIKNAISVETAYRLFKIGYCKRSKRTVIPVFAPSGRVYGVISRATRKSDFIRYGVGVPDETYPNEGWKMKLDFRKSLVVYNEDKWNRFKNDTILVLESALDVIYAYECGLNEHMDIGALMGAKASYEQIKKISQYPNVIVALDNDEAGQENAPFLIDNLQKEGCDVYIFDNYGKKDLGECTPDEVKNLMSRVKKLESERKIFV